MADFAQYGLAPFGAAPNARHMEWYARERTAFLHFGVNTFTDREWGDGTESEALFAPGELDCRQWARVLKEGGFTAVILTAKHHDGFCLWHTETTTHHALNSPARTDVVGAFCDACREYGLKPGLYISPWDRFHPAWGTEGYNDVFAAQLTELMTRYGQIWECWWDGAGSTEACYDWARWATIVRENQPRCVLFGCLGAAEYVDVRWVGNEEGRAGDPCWATIEPETIEAERCADLNRGKFLGSRFIPAETNTSIRPGWFFHESQNDRVRSPEDLISCWYRSAGRNSVLLLNLPPDRRGLLHETDAHSIRRWNALLTRMFSRDLTRSAQITADAPLHPECVPENLLTPDEDRIYAASTLTPAITLTFPAPVTFDCFELREVIELGHRVHTFALEVRRDGRWHTVTERACIGFRRCQPIVPVTADAVRLRILDAAAPPVLRRIALYNTGGLGRTTAAPLPGELKTRILPETGGVAVELEGILPFNTVSFTATGAVTIERFNGTRYEPLWTGASSPAVFPTVTGSYRLRLLGTPDPDSIRVSLQ